MQTFRAVRERSRNLEAVPMTIYAPDGEIELRRVDGVRYLSGRLRFGGCKHSAP